MTRLALALAVLTATPALAAGPDTMEPQIVAMAAAPAPAPAFVFSLRGGVAGNPAYFGSDEMEAGPDFGFKFHFLRLPSGRELGNPDPWTDTPGWSFHGAFNYIGERDPNDHAELAGLNKVDAAVELGFGVTYTAETYEAFADVRRGFGGHEGFVLELGADAVFRPSSQLKITLGPRVLFGDDTYTGTYFGVTAGEASAALPYYNPIGGIVSIGAELGMRYQINDIWGLEGAVSYNALDDIAKDSPIVRQGSSDQWGIRLGVARVFSLGG